MMPTMTQTQVKITTDAIDPRNVRAIELADGWHDITECELVQFAVGESHSPITPSKVYPALRYKNEFSKLVRTPLNKVLGFSEEPQNRR